MKFHWNIVFENELELISEHYQKPDHALFCSFRALFIFQTDSDALCLHKYIWISEGLVYITQKRSQNK